MTPVGNFSDRTVSEEHDQYHVADRGIHPADRLRELYQSLNRPGLQPCREVAVRKVLGGNRNNSGCSSSVKQRVITLFSILLAVGIICRLCRCSTR